MSSTEDYFNREMAKRRKRLFEWPSRAVIDELVIVTLVLAGFAGLVYALSQEEQGVWTERNPVATCHERRGVLAITDTYVFCRDGSRWELTYIKYGK